MSVIHACASAGPATCSWSTPAATTGRRGELFGTEASDAAWPGSSSSAGPATPPRSPGWRCRCGRPGSRQRVRRDGAARDRRHLSLDGVRVDPGELLVGDDDGLVVGTEAELARGGRRRGGDRGPGEEPAGRMLDGASLFDVMNYDEHLAACATGAPAAWPSADAVTPTYCDQEVRRDHVRPPRRARAALGDPRVPRPRRRPADHLVRRRLPRPDALPDGRAARDLRRAARGGQRVGAAVHGIRGAARAARAGRRAAQRRRDAVHRRRRADHPGRAAGPGPHGQAVHRPPAT